MSTDNSTDHQKTCCSTKTNLIRPTVVGENTDLSSVSEEGNQRKTLSMEDIYRAWGFRLKWFKVDLSNQRADQDWTKFVIL